MRKKTRWLARELIAVSVLGVAIVIAVAALLIWRGPWWFDGKYLSDHELRSGSASLVSGLRAAVAQLVTAVGVSIALIYTGFNYRLTRRGQITDRFAKALERLDSEQLHTRIGGVLALKQIGQDAADYAADAAVILTEFVRRYTSLAEQPPNAGLPDKPSTDIQHALTALTNRDFRRHLSDPGVIDLSRLHLVRARFDDGDLTRVNLAGSDLSHASLRRARFDYTDLARTCLHEARLAAADLRKARSLQVGQIVSARPTAKTRLPADLATTRAVEARVRAVETAVTTWSPPSTSPEP